MDTLTDVYNQFSSIDEQLEKQASKMVKQAEEEEFAGRIMARGFADEMSKLAEGVIPMGKGKEYATVKSKSYAAAAGGSDTKLPGQTGAGPAIMGGRKARAPAVGPTPKPAVAKGGGAAAGPSVKSPFASQKGGGGLMASAVGTQKGQRTSAAPKSYSAPGGAKPLNMGGGGAAKPAGGMAGAAKPVGSVVGKLNLNTKMPSLG